MTPLGLGCDASWKELLTGRSAIRRLQPEHLPEEHRHVLPLLQCQVAGVVDTTQFEAFFGRDLVRPSCLPKLYRIANVTRVTRTNFSM